MIARLVDRLERFAALMDRVANWLERQADELETMAELRAARHRRGASR